jgi:hypothetical protein
MRPAFPIVNLCECHGLAPWIVTFVATPLKSDPSADATGSPRGVSRSFLNRRDAPATSVTIHRTSLWHLSVVVRLRCSDKRKLPRDKPVAFPYTASNSKATPASLTAGGQRPARELTRKRRERGATRDRCTKSRVRVGRWPLRLNELCLARVPRTCPCRFAVG